MIVPPQALSKEILNRLLEEYVTREGTFVGDGDQAALDDDVNRLRVQLYAGDIFITYDEETETVSLCSKEDAQRFRDES